MTISLVEHPDLEWQGRFSYLIAKREKRQLELYAMDLLWSIAKQYYDGLPMPSEIWAGKRKDDRSGKQILNDLMKGLGGE